MNTLQCILRFVCFVAFVDDLATFGFSLAIALRPFVRVSVLLKILNSRPPLGLHVAHI